MNEEINPYHFKKRKEEWEQQIPDSIRHFFRLLTRVQCIGRHRTAVGLLYPLEQEWRT